MNSSGAAGESYDHRATSTMMKGKLKQTISSHRDSNETATLLVRNVFPGLSSTNQTLLHSQSQSAMKSAAKNVKE